MTMDHLPTSSRMPAYASGAASAALSARLGSAASHPSAELTGRLMSSAHQPMRKSSSSLPVVIENFVEGAKSFIRKTCDATTQYYERQAENKRIESLGRQAIGKAFANGWNSLTAANYREYEAQRNQMEQNSLAQLLLLEDMWNSAAQAAYVNQVLYEQRQKEIAKTAVSFVLRPLTENIQSELLKNPSTLQFGGNITASGGVTLSCEVGWAIDSFGNVGRYYTLSRGLTTGEGVSGSIIITSTTAPDIELLGGSSYSFGGSVGEGYVIGIAGEQFENPETGKVYYGTTVSFGAGVGSPIEGHMVYADSTVTTSFNVFKKLYALYDNVENIA